jgi:CHAT domain-containing protein
MNRALWRRVRGALLAGAVAACTSKERAPPVSLARGEAPLTLSADPASLATMLGVAPESLFAAGREFYQRDAFDSARAIWHVEAARASTPDSATLGRTLMWLGLAERHLGNLPLALAQEQQALAVQRRLGLDRELSRTFNSMGLIAWDQGHYALALVHFDSATVTAQRNGDSVGVIRAALNVPLVHVELGDFLTARQGFVTVAAAARSIGNEQFLANALANLAMLEVRVGDPSAAIPLLHQARTLYHRLDYRPGEANALGQLATAWSALGNLQRAIAAADSDLALARADGLVQEVASILEVLSDLHLEAGSPRLALLRLREADSIDVALGLRTEHGKNLRRSAAILLGMGEAATAVRRAEAALQVHHAVAARGEAALDRVLLAQGLSAAGDDAGAARESEVAARDAGATDNPSIMRDAAAAAAQIALDQGHPKRALRLAMHPRPEQSPNDWTLMHIRAGALLALGRLAEARIEAEQAVAAIERERSTLALGPLRSAFLVGRAEPFARLVAIDLAQGDTTGAFLTAAALPGRALTERLGAVGGGSAPMTGSSAGERLLREAAELERELDQLGGSETALARRAILEQHLRTTRSAYAESIAHHAPTPSEQLLGLGRLSLPAVQAALRDGEALLTLLSSNDRLDIFVVTRTRLAHRREAVGARDLAARVRVARELLQRGGSPREALQAMGDLHDLLLGGLEGDGILEGARRLIVVPHGATAALPFAALWNRTTGRYLVQDAVISYLPAVAALGASGSSPALSVRDVQVFAPLPDSLPGTLSEARAIGRLVPAAALALGRRSNEATVRRALESSRVVHIASHGMQNSQNPLFSAMTIGREFADDPADDGKLSVHEILRMHVTSPLVFLSGCETGLAGSGQEPFGRSIEEGGLAQALLVAGAGTVVATLWRVDDQAAAGLAAAFYHGMVAGIDPAGALAQAQRQLIGRGDGLGWAAYTVAGAHRRKTGANVRVTDTKS